MFVQFVAYLPNFLPDETAYYWKSVSTHTHAWCLEFLLQLSPHILWNEVSWCSFSTILPNTLLKKHCQLRWAGLRRRWSHYCYIFSICMINFFSNLSESHKIEFKKKSFINHKHYFSRNDRSQQRQRHASIIGAMSKHGAKIALSFCYQLSYTSLSFLLMASVLCITATSQ